MPVDLKASGAGAPRKEWTITGRFVFFSLLAFFGVVVAVNGVMMTLAIRTFPGIDARNGYEVSQAYNKEIAAARAQMERGWSSDTVLAGVGESARLTMTLRTASGAPVTGLAAEARVRHPSDRKLDHVVLLNEFAPGVYQADVSDLADGNWGVTVAARQNGERVYQTETRLTLKR